MRGPIKMPIIEALTSFALSETSPAGGMHLEIKLQLRTGVAFDKINCDDYENAMK